MKQNPRLFSPAALHWSDKISALLLYVLLADCCIFGSGRVLAAGNLGFRTLLGGAVLIAALPQIAAQCRSLLRNRCVLIAALFVLWLAASALLGLVQGNDRGVLVSDLRGFMYIVLLVPAVCILRTPTRIRNLMQVMLYSSGLLAILHVGTFWSYLLAPEKTEWLFRDFLGLQMGWLDRISPTVTRLFFRSGIYLLCGCGFSLYFFIFEEKKCRYPILAGLCLFALLLSFTRSLYLGAFIAAAFCMCCVLFPGTPDQRKKLLLFCGIAAAVFLLVTAVFSLTQRENYLGFAFNRLFPQTLSANEDTRQMLSVHPLLESTHLDEYLQSSQQSDALRRQTMAEMFRKIAESPLFGSGLGIHWTVRSETGGLSEYFYLDLWAKTGLIGLVLYLSPVVWMLCQVFRKRCAPCCRFWLGILLGFLAISYFNPYMNSSLGILYYCCTMAVFSRDCLQKQ